MDIWNELVKLEKEGIPAALVTVIHTRGSTPREIGAKMIVTLDGNTSGTIGGSAVEALVIEKAKEAISKGKVLRVEYDLDDVEKTSTGMVCGGKMEFFIEPLKRFPRLYIFGGGHVGLALAKMAAVLEYPHVIIDDRPEYTTSERFPQALERHTGSLSGISGHIELVQPAYIIVVTRCHDTDLEVMRGVLGKPYEYLGMICSRKKRAEVFKILEEEGFSKEELGRVHAPIGLDIGSKTPAEIAISILAEVISEFQKAKPAGR